MQTLKPELSLNPTVSDKRHASSRWPLAFVGVMLLAASVRLYQLGTESLWIDEGFSLRDAVTPFTYAKASKPLYFWMMSFWVKLSESDWFLRLPAVVFGVASVALVFAIGRLIWGNRTGLLAALIVAVSPLQVEHSQEVRMYTLLMLNSLASVYFLVLALRTWRFRYMAASGLFAWLAILTQPMACLLLLSENLAVLDAYLRKRRPILPWIATQLVVVLAWLPWLHYLIGFDTYFEQSWGSLMDRPTVFDLPKLWGQFGIGDWDPRFSHLLLRETLYAYTFLSVFLVAAISWIERHKPETRLVALWFFVPGAALLTMSTIRINALIPRYLVFTAPAFALLLGAIWARQRNRLVFALFAFWLLLVPAGKLVRYYQNTTRPEWRQAAAYVTAREKPSDRISIYRYGNIHVFGHYYRGRAEWGPLGPDTLTRAQIEDRSEKTALKLLGSIPPAPRQWLVVSRVPMAANESIHTAIREHYRLLSVREFYGISVYLFEGPRHE